MVMISKQKSSSFIKEEGQRAERAFCGRFFIEFIILRLPTSSPARHRTLIVPISNQGDHGLRRLVIIVCNIILASNSKQLVVVHYHNCTTSIIIVLLLNMLSVGWFHYPNHNDRNH